MAGGAGIAAAAAAAAVCGGCACTWDRFAFCSAATAFGMAAGC